MNNTIEKEVPFYAMYHEDITTGITAMIFDYRVRGRIRGKARCEVQVKVLCGEGREWISIDKAVRRFTACFAVNGFPWIPLRFIKSVITAKVLEHVGNKYAPIPPGYRSKQRTAEELEQSRYAVK